MIDTPHAGAGTARPARFGDRRPDTEKARRLGTRWRQVRTRTELGRGRTVIERRKRGLGRGATQMSRREVRR